MQLHILHLGDFFFFARARLPFGGSTVLRLTRRPQGIEPPRQSVSAVKNDALPTEPRGHLFFISVKKMFSVQRLLAFARSFNTFNCMLQEE